MLTSLRVLKGCKDYAEMFVCTGAYSKIQTFCQLIVLVYLIVVLVEVHLILCLQHVSHAVLC